MNTSNWQIVIVCMFVFFVIFVVAAVLCKSPIANHYCDCCFEFISNAMPAKRPLYRATANANEYDNEEIEVDIEPETANLLTAVDVHEKSHSLLEADIKERPSRANSMTSSDARSSGINTGLLYLHGGCPRSVSTTTFTVDEPMILYKPLRNGKLGQIETIVHAPSRTELNVTILSIIDLVALDSLVYTHCYLRISVQCSERTSTHLSSGMTDSVDFEPAQTKTSKVYRVGEFVDIGQRFAFVHRAGDLCMGSCLKLELNAYGRTAAHLTFAKATLPLEDFQCDRPLRLLINLVEVSEPDIIPVGDIAVALSYLPTAERLTVFVDRARSLEYITTKHAIEPLNSRECYVKIYLIRKGRVVSRKKTKLQPISIETIFNEAAIFRVKAQHVETAEVRLAIVEKTTGDHHLIGHVIIGAHSSDVALTHWQTMMENPRKPISMWHALCPCGDELEFLQAAEVEVAVEQQSDVDKEVDKTQ